MEITLTRFQFTEKTTIGDLVIPTFLHTFFCLEDKDRNLYQKTPLTDIAHTKVMGKTAIPYGRYEVAMTWSERFKKIMPLLLDVPGFAGIRIHAGNTAEDTDGCLLVGMEALESSIIRSRDAINIVYPILSEACAREKVFITIKKVD